MKCNELKIIAVNQLEKFPKNTDVMNQTMIDLFLGSFNNLINIIAFMMADAV